MQRLGSRFAEMTLVRFLFACAALTATASAVPLPPGATVPLPGSNEGGLVIHDELIPFVINAPTGGPLFAGTLQNRVVRLNSTGRLSFGYFIRDTQPGLNGVVVALETIDFSGFFTNVDFDPTGLGTVAPNQASRSASGVTVEFDFLSPELFSGQESEFCVIRTDADCFRDGGRTTIRLIGGPSVTLPTVMPIRNGERPIADITSPAPFACTCNPAEIIGTAAAPGGDFGGYRLEYAVDPSGPWSLIGTGDTPVLNGLLAPWNTTTVPAGYVFLRLTVFGGCDDETVFVTVVYVDHGFDTIDVRSPVSGEVYGGVVCFDGTVWDYCFDEYRVAYSPNGVNFFPVDPGNPVYNTPVINDPFAFWDTRTLGLPDGNYETHVVGLDICGHTDSATQRLVLDNTPPDAKISVPENCECVSGLVGIFGTVGDDHLRGWVLQYTGGDSNGWVTIASGNGPINDALIASWDTRELRPCCYTIRLIASDQANVDCGRTSNQTEFLISVDVGQCEPTHDFDVDDDGDIDLDDYAQFQSEFTGP